MNHTRRFAAIVGCVAAALLSAAPAALGQSGHTNWGAWSFDWEVKDGAALGIRNVTFGGRYVIYKASLPVIRVEYAQNACGPYADQIDWGNLDGVPWCNNAKVCQRSFNLGGFPWLELGVHARLGGYKLYHVWYFRSDGWIQARFFSRGLHCNNDHNHHPYWRLDFDIDGAARDQVFVYDNNRPSEGWGPGWHLYTEELNGVKNPPTNRVWFVRDAGTARGAWVIPNNSSDGTPDNFSTKDFGARQYHWNEDQPWAFGATGHLGYDNGEPIKERDVIFWYVAHMHHHAAGGGDQWHGAGPWIKVHGGGR